MIKDCRNIIFKGISVLFILCFFQIQICNAQNNSQEYMLKAGFMERFTRFIDFPDTVLSADPDSLFYLGVIGDDPFNGLLESIFKDVPIKEHKVKIVYFERDSVFTPCHMLFISSSEQDHIAQIMQQFRSKPIITVGDSEGFGEEGVMFNFYIAQNKVRFEINLNTVNQSGLKISHLLLKAGRPVK